MFSDSSGQLQLKITEYEFDALKNLIQERLANHNNGMALLGNNLLSLITSLNEKVSDGSTNWSYV